MKRGGAKVVLRLLLHIWSGCGGLLNGVAVADVKCCCAWGGAPYRAWSRCSSINAWTYCFQQCCSVHWARHCMQCSSEPDCGPLLYVVQTAFGRVVECGRAKCA
jgi:hypothetical protein